MPNCFIVVAWYVSTRRSCEAEPKDAPWKRSVRARLGPQNWEFFEQLAGWYQYRNIPIHPLQLLENTHQDAFLSFFPEWCTKKRHIGSYANLSHLGRLVWHQQYMLKHKQHKQWSCWHTSTCIRTIPGKDTGGAKPGLRIWMNLGVTRVFFSLNFTIKEMTWFLRKSNESLHECTTAHPNSGP